MAQWANKQGDAPTETKKLFSLLPFFVCFPTDRSFESLKGTIVFGGPMV